MATKKQTKKKLNEKKKNEDEKKELLNLAKKIKELTTLGKVPTPNIVDIQISRAIAHKRNSEYEQSLKIYELLFEEYAELLQSQVIVGWAKTLACSGRYKEAIKKYKEAILRAKYEKNSEKVNVYSGQLKKLYNKDALDFFNFLREISGNINYILQPEIEYIEELDSLNFEDKNSFTSEEVANFFECEELIQEITLNLLKKCKSLITSNFDLKDELNLHQWIFNIEEDFWLPTKFKIVENLNILEVNNKLTHILECTLENSNHSEKVLKYALNNGSVKHWNEFKVMFDPIEFNSDFTNSISRLNDLYVANQNYIFTNRCIKTISGTSMESVDIDGNVYLFVMPSSYEMDFKENINYNFGIEKTLVYCILNFKKNKKFYLKCMISLILINPKLLINSILSILICEILSEYNLLTTSEKK